MLNEVPKECSTYEQYITRIEKGLLTDLRKSYPDAEIEKEDAVWDALTKVYEYCDQEQFIFVLDEWDYIYHQSYMTTAYSTYFGFTDEEVDSLYEKYLQTEPSPQVTREGLELWYDGYQTTSGTKLYNPRSVVGALTYNQLRSYWTSSGPYDEIFYYIGANVDAVKDDVALMVNSAKNRNIPAEFLLSALLITKKILRSDMNARWKYYVKNCPKKLRAVTTFCMVVTN